MTRLTRSVWAIAGLLALIATWRLFVLVYDADGREAAKAVEAGIQAKADERHRAWKGDGEYDRPKEYHSNLESYGGPVRARFVHIHSVNGSVAVVRVEARLGASDPWTTMFDEVNPDAAGKMWSLPDGLEYRAITTGYAAGDIKVKWGLR